MFGSTQDNHERGNVRGVEGGDAGDHQRSGPDRITSVLAVQKNAGLVKAE